ncbi:hypothetical protein BC833DRAFT_582857 [Globomyces pollinis-pini]|nr:hypothetical protein BC833DRAFT_582857 [Globomyces pollinis-pini]
MYILPFIFFTAHQIHADPVILSEWSKTDCEGPPTSMVVFELSDPAAEYASDNNETWPYTYDFFRNENPIDFPCYYYSQGYFTIEEKEICCASSMQLEKTVVQSASYIYLDTEDMSNSLPVTIKNRHYCHLSNAMLDSERLFGYQSSYVLKGQCSNGILCELESLSIYQQINCTELIENHSISNVLTAYNTSIGEIDIEIVSFESGSRTVGWTTLIPQRLMLPFALKNITSDVNILLNIVALLGSLIACSYFGTRYRNRKMVNDLLLFVNQIIWLNYLVLDLILKLTIMPTEFSFVLIPAIIYALCNIGQLLGTISTWMLLYQTFIKESNRSLYIPMGYLIIILVHFILTGSDLGWVLVYFDYDDRIYIFLMEWCKLNCYWIILMYIWNILPTALLLQKLLKTKSDKHLPWFDRLWKYLRKDMIFLASIFLYSLNGISYFTMSILYNYYSKIWGNDRSMWAAYSIQIILIAYHTLIHAVILHRLPYVMQLKTKGSKHGGKKQKPGGDPRHSEQDSKKPLNS